MDVVITGSASGIGLALAKRFARDGHRIALVDLNEATLAEAAATVDAETLQIVCDVTNREECEAAVAQIINNFGGIDILVNNAGISHQSRFEVTDPSVYEKIMGVNLFGAIYFTKAALPSLIERQGRIGVLSSIAGFAPLLGRTGYCASKYALHGLFETMRLELASKGVSVTFINPTFVKTNIHRDKLGADGKIAGFESTTLGKFLTPEQVADALHNALLKRKRMVVLTPRGKAAYLISRVAPRLYERMMRQSFKKELER